MRMGYIDDITGTTYVGQQMDVVKSEKDNIYALLSGRFWDNPNYISPW